MFSVCFSFLSLPKPHSASPLGSLVRAIFLTVFALATLSLLAARPAQAQNTTGSWVVSPCDADGNSLSYNNMPLDDKGFYVMRGTEEWTVTHTYPSIIDYILSTPSEYNGWNRTILGAAYPTYLNTGVYPSTGSVYEGLGSRARVGPDEADAGNASGGYNWWYSVYLPGSSTPDTGTLNGSVTAAMFGHLVYYFKVDWQSYSSDPTPPLPDHISLLLRTNVEAEASVHGSAGTASIGEAGQAVPSPNAGLWAISTATDGLPFGETATSGAGLDSNGNFVATVGPAKVEGYHLVRATVNPSTHIATVYLDGTLKWQANNPILYGTLDTSDPYRPFGIVTNGPTSARASGYIAGGVKQDNREVAISSDIETSYFKSNDGYSGSPVQAQHYRNPDGSIAVDSIVFPVNDPQTGQHFIAGHTYYSNASGFTFPKFVWSITGDGTPDSMTTGNLGRTPDHPNGFTDLPATLDFGTTWDLTKTKTSQFQVTVTDSDGVIAVNTYNVTWHAPAENFKVTTLKRDVPKLVGGLQSIVVNATIPANLSIPGQEGQIDWGDVQHKSGLAVAVTGSAAGGLLLIPEVAAGPAGWTIIVGQAIAAGLAYKMGLADLTHPGTVPIEGNADYNEYLSDLNHQVAINQQPDGQKDMVRFKPEALAEQALAASQAPDHWGSDSYFMGCTAQWQGGWYTDISDSLGDGYDVNGYTYSVPAHAEIPTHLFKYFVWTCSTPLPQ